MPDVSSAQRRPGAGPRVLTLLLLVLALLAPADALTPTSSAAVAAPGGLGVAMQGSATPVLSWSRVNGNPAYDIQIDDDPGFSTPALTSWTYNRRFVPNTALPSGTLHWRVRSRTDGGDTSDWSQSSTFVVAPVEVPVPTHPVDGAVLQQPDSPALLRWQASRGATSYTVEVDGDADFVGASSWTTRSTAFVVPRALAAGDWHWRVSASKGEGIVSRPSGSRRFQITPLRSPQLVSPASTFDERVEDVVLDWEPVPGAQAYDVQVALDQNFQNYAVVHTGVKGTRWSPPVTIPNDEFWWRVRAVDSSGQSTPWTASRYDFKRQWLDEATPVWPVGNDAAPGLQGVDSTFYQWTPVQHATYYELQVSSDRNFNGTLSCLTAGTTYIPRLDGDECLAKDTAQAAEPRYWRVRAFDRPYDGGDRRGLPGVWSRPQTFHREPQPAPEASTQPPGHATGLKVAMTGSGLRDAAKGCEGTLSVGYPGTTYTPPSVCGPVGATPVFSWDPYPGAVGYRVWFAQDENFTTTHLQPVTTTLPMLAIDEREPQFNRGPWTLPESEAGRPYYWYVQPCTSTGCAMRPDSLSPGVTGAASFRKVSPAVTGLTSPDRAGNDVTFSWDDYETINRASTSLGEPGQQTAQNYRIQVDDEASFSDPLLDSRVVDQTTYTAFDRLYPEGTLYWRVQALDAGDDFADTTGHALTWSSVQEVSKTSAPVTLRSPIGGAQGPGTTPLEWATQPFAVEYQVEVYRNADAAYSPANRVLQVTTGTSSFAPRDPLPASDSAYVWRVRRIDASDNPGPWSPPGRFFSTGAAPELLEPTQGGLQEARGIFTSWSDVAAAASYRIVFRRDGTNVLERTTTATAYAPSMLGNGDYTWTVTALDSAGQSLATSQPGRFSVDGVAPAVTSVKPRRLKASSTLKVVFGEPVSGLSTRTVKLKRGRKAVRVRVRALDGGTVAVVDPRSRLRRGTHTLVFSTAQITDRAGNALTTSRRSIGWGR